MSNIIMRTRLICTAHLERSDANIRIQTVTFNVAGTSKEAMNVTAVLNVTAYGTSVYSNSFNPCDASTFVSQLCPGTLAFLMKKLSECLAFHQEIQ